MEISSQTPVKFCYNCNWLALLKQGEPITFVSTKGGGVERQAASGSARDKQRAFLLNHTYYASRTGASVI
jgi:hypothetical protein